MHHMAQRALRSGEVVFPMMGSRNGLAALVKGTSGNAYIVAIALPERPPQRNVFREVTHGFLGWRLLILLGVTALVCYFLARSLTSPIVKLRKAIRKVATGDLSVRVGGQIRGRDEISGLARDFDEMAAQIEGLVGSQKRLLRDISHELRSPLTRLGIALELARKQANPESQEKAFARIELEAERMNSMIGQLLELTRLESGAERAEHHQVDLVALLDELVRDAGFEAQSRQCQVSFSVAGEVPLFCGSPELLRRAFENVIRNAVKYTAPGTRVEVKLKAGDGKIWIQILDRGPGVPEETLEKLFTPFYRVADARERESGGTGIGLAIADRSVRLHGGTIRAENRSRGGLKIEISLRATGSSKL
jgi:two-component system sensor histidine kinase CpxA